MTPEESARAAELAEALSEIEKCIGDMEHYISDPDLPDEWLVDDVLLALEAARADRREVIGQLEALGLEDPAT